MKRISPLLLTVTLFVLVVCVGSILMVVPLYADLSQIQNTIDTLPPATQTKTVTLTTQQQQLTALKQSADLLLPPADQQYDLSVQVEALCRAAGVAITTMSFSGAVDPIPKTTAAVGAAPVSSATTPKLTITLGVQGSYAAIQQVVGGLTSLSRFIQIDQLAVSAGQAVTGSNTSTLAAQITAFAYYLPGNPSAATPTPTSTP